MQNFKMKISWVISIIICQFRPYSCFNSQPPYGLSNDENYYPWVVKYHYPGRFTTAMTPFVNGTEEQIASIWDTPDYRIEEPHFVPVSYKYVELERPYRNSPAYKTFHYYGNRGYGKQSKIMHEMGCYCNTVYKRLTLLAGCAVLTRRHILTTATPTMLIINSYKHKQNLDNIFGGWYDININSFNSSMYFSASRIHVHPQYTYAFEVNVSHPIPAMFDLALIATQVLTYQRFFTGAYLCERAGSGRFEYTHTIPSADDVSIVAGFQFIKSYNRRPLPWFRYIVHTKAHVWPCPKSEWQWFHCIMGEYWGKYGFDSGGGMGASFIGFWRYNGLSGLCAFSMKLRSKQTVHYFTVVDTYPVLDFLYDAMLGLVDGVWLDYRFSNTKWAAPVPYEGEYISYNYELGEEAYYSQYQIPYF